MDISDITTYHELQAYTLAHGDPKFIHQYVVDAWTAQHADEKTKPIALTFALVGLYLHVEKGLTGLLGARCNSFICRWRGISESGSRFLCRRSEG